MAEKNSCDAETRKFTLALLAFCKKIDPYINYYRRQIKSYNITAHNILKNKIDLILPQLITKQKPGIITTLVSSFIRLAYEGISSFLHNKRNKALHKAVKAMGSKSTIQCNKLMQLEYSMVMYGIYNAETLEQLRNTVITFIILCLPMRHYLQDSKAQYLCDQYMQMHKASQHYSINSLLYLRMIKDKYVLLYKEFITQLHIYTAAIRILAKGYLPFSLITPLKLREILNKVRTTLQKTNQDYDLVIKGLHLCYNMKLVTFGIDKDKNLIVQFPVFIQPYTQQPLILHQIETVPVPIIDKNTQEQSYTHLWVGKLYITLNSETYIMIRQQELRTCKRIGHEFYCEELFIVKHKSKYSCESTIYFDLDSEIIRENCKFDFYYKKWTSLLLY